MARTSSDDTSASERITAMLAEPGDWRLAMLRRLRDLITKADPDIVEELKWAKPSNPDGVPTWSHDGIVCTGEIYRDKVKLTFAAGASLEDPAGLFNASLEGGTRRAIDLREGDDVDDRAFTALVRAAVARNSGAGTGSRKRSSARRT